MKITDRYASAVHSRNLKSREETLYSDADVVGAAGFAGKQQRGQDSADARPGHPLAMALMRLFAGDNRAVREIVVHMAELVWNKAHAEGLKVRRVEAESIAQAVLAWHRDGVCKTCGGHGYQLVAGAPSLSENKCQSCYGEGKRPFDGEFPETILQLARWLLAEVEREMGKAGPAAMAALAPRLDL